MTLVLFSLRGVPEDEADEVRELLTSQDIDFYETSAGNWGMSMPALWLKDDADLEKARYVLNKYQQQRFLTSHQDYLQRKKAGQQKTLLKAFIEKPLLYFAYILTMFLVVYVSIRLLFELGL
jgi:nucleosome binding factor SPN SPT16 subunit